MGVVTANLLFKVADRGRFDFVCIPLAADSTGSVQSHQEPYVPMSRSDLDVTGEGMLRRAGAMALHRARLVVAGDRKDIAVAGC